MLTADSLYSDGIDERPRRPADPAGPGEGGGGSAADWLEPNRHRPDHVHLRRPAVDDARSRLVRSVRAALWSGDRALVHEAQRCSTQQTDSRTLAQIDMVAALVFGAGSPRFRSGRRGSGPDDVWSYFADVLCNGSERRRQGEVVDAADELLRILDLESGLPELALTALLAIIGAGRPDRALRWCATLAVEAAWRDTPALLAMLTAARAECLMRCDQPRGAVREVRTALALLPAPSWGIYLGLPLAVGLSAATALGDVPRDLLTLPRPETMDATAFGALHLAAHDGHLLATTCADAARGSVETSLRQIPRAGGRWTAHAPPAYPLSPAELRVADLAAAGSSNKVISRRLCITVSTVEQHLTRVYRKLGVSTRRQLVRSLESGGTGIAVAPGHAVAELRPGRPGLRS